jgi:hypothetical protein
MRIVQMEALMIRCLEKWSRIVRIFTGLGLSSVATPGGVER